MCKICCQLKASRWPRGKVLGGTSILNYMMYVRGNRQDYDHWHELGSEGWSFEDVLPYFIRSENNRGAFIDGEFTISMNFSTNFHLNFRTELSEGFHGRDGPLSVEDPWVTQLSDAFIEAGMELGYDHVDVNGINQTGDNLMS